MPELTALKVNDTVNVAALGRVVAVRTSERQRGSDDYTVEVQIEQINVTSKKKLKNMTMAEYNKARDKGQVK